MADVLVYKNGFVQLKKSCHTPEYEGDPLSVINPVLPSGVPIRRLKVVNGQVRLKTWLEKNADDTKFQTDKVKVNQEKLIQEEIRALAIASLKRRGAWV